MGARVSARVAGNLPVEVTSFVGRRRELARARELLADSRLVTLTGPGGVGKTRLALRVAAESRRAFPDGVWFVDLAAVSDGELVAGSVVAALGISDRTSRPVEVLREFVRDKRLLLVLDNCEQVLDSCAVLVSGLLSVAPQLRVLTTSREPLDAAGEHVLAVAPLSVPGLDVAVSPADVERYEALRLFAERASAAVPGFAVTAASSGVIAAVCRRLDGIPLAIELAVVWLAAVPDAGDHPDLRPRTPGRLRRTGPATPCAP